jgi:glycosyltransferase involved in cell wall biosynthesis
MHACAPLDMMPSPYRLLFVIRALDIGGAQRQLVELLKGLDPVEFTAAVAVLYPGGVLEEELRGLPHVSIVPLEKRGRWDIVGFLWRLRVAVQRVRPQVVYGYMLVGNELALLAGAMSRARVIWGLRTARADHSVYHWSLGPLFRLSILLSRFPDLIISNSEAGRRYHASVGYRQDRLRVVANGIDCDRFRPDAWAGAAARQRWGIPLESILVGVVARIDENKDHPTFLAAMRSLRDVVGVRVVCVGDGPPGALERLRQQVRDAGLDGMVQAVGEERDMPAVYNALDLLVSSSVVEAFSNVIAEAMSCGVPCVVTDAGDSRLIVGDTGSVVPVADPDALAAAIRALLPRARDQAVREMVRARVVTQFGRARMVADTVGMLRSLLSPYGGGSRSYS